MRFPLNLKDTYCGVYRLGLQSLRLNEVKYRKEYKLPGSQLRPERVLLPIAEQNWSLLPTLDCETQFRGLFTYTILCVDIHIISGQK